MSREVRESKRLGSGWEAQLLFALTLILVACGIVTLYSASTVWAERLGLPAHHFALSQMVGAFIGFVLLAIGYLLPYRIWQHAAWPLLIGCAFTLLLSVIPGTEGIAPEINGARRWLRFGGIQIQPSEVAKFALILWTATMVVHKQEVLGDFQYGALPLFVGWLSIAGLIYVEPNVSTAFIAMLTAVVVAYAGGARIRHMLIIGTTMMPIVLAQLGAVKHLGPRMRAYLDLYADPSGAGYQIKQSLIAFGSGGLVGRGFGASQQKYGYLPEPHNDFILAMVGEEWGFVGVIVLGLLYFSLVATGFRIARQAPDLFGYLIAIGITTLIAIHVIFHMGVNLGLLPTTGVILPLFSYGRSGMIMMLFEIGVLMNVARTGAGRSTT